jgi:hypothetical protein
MGYRGATTVGKEHKTVWKGDAGRARAGAHSSEGMVVEMSVGMSKGWRGPCCCGGRAWAGFVTSMSLFGVSLF